MAAAFHENLPPPRPPASVVHAPDLQTTRDYVNVPSIPLKPPAGRRSPDAHDYVNTPSVPPPPSRPKTVPVDRLGGVVIGSPLKPKKPSLPPLELLDRSSSESDSESDNDGYSQPQDAYSKPPTKQRPSSTDEDDYSDLNRGAYSQPQVAYEHPHASGTLPKNATLEKRQTVSGSVCAAMRNSTPVGHLIVPVSDDEADDEADDGYSQPQDAYEKPQPAPDLSAAFLASLLADRENKHDYESVDDAAPVENRRAPGAPEVATLRPATNQAQSRSDSLPMGGVSRQQTKRINPALKFRQEQANKRAQSGLPEKELVIPSPVAPRSLLRRIFGCCFTKARPIPAALAPSGVRTLSRSKTNTLQTRPLPAPESDDENDGGGGGGDYENEEEI